MTQPAYAAEPTRPTPIGAILLAVGGALSAISSFLAWASVEVTIDLSEFGVPAQTQSVSVKGVDGTDGFVTLVAGLVMLAGAVALFAGRSAGARRGLAIAGIVGGVIATGLGVYDLVRLEAQFESEVAKQIQEQSPGTNINEFLDVVTFEVGPSIGLYGVIAGGILGLVGGVMGLRSAGAGAAPPPPPPSFGAAPPPSPTGFGAGPSTPPPPAPTPPGPSTPPGPPPQPGTP